MSQPIFSGGGLKEDFNFYRKPAYMTPWVQALFDENNPHYAQLFLGHLLPLYFEMAKVHPLDYLQKLTIDQTPVWLIDDGATICLLLPEEY
jgi:hypothetical protein